MLRHLALTALVLAALGCSERSFRGIEEEDPEEEGNGGTRDRSPWDQLDGTERPDALFAASWHAREDVALTSVRWGCYAVETGPPTIGFFDLDGRVLLTLEPPDPTWGLLRDPLTGESVAMPLSPVSDASVLVVSVEGAAGPEPGRRHAWLADGFHEQSVPWLSWDGATADTPSAHGRLTIDASGEVVDLGGEITDLRVTADPTEERVVWVSPVWTSPSWDLPVLFRLELDDPDGLRVWTPEDLFVGRARPDIDGLLPAVLRVQTAGRRTRVGLELVGVRHRTDGHELVGPAILAVVDPLSGLVVWTRQGSYLPLRPAALGLDADGHASWLWPAFQDDLDVVWAVLDHQDADKRSAVINIPEPSEDRFGCARTVALLDASTHTALMHRVRLEDQDGDGTREPATSELVIMHEGRSILEIPGLAQGLGRADVYLHDVVLLDAP